MGRNVSRRVRRVSRVRPPRAGARACVADDAGQAFPGRLYVGSRIVHTTSASDYWVLVNSLGNDWEGA
jgi:hypothetical protein